MDQLSGVSGARCRVVGLPSVTLMIDVGLVSLLLGDMLSGGASFAVHHGLDGFVGAL